MLILYRPLIEHPCLYSLWAWGINKQCSLPKNIQRYLPETH